MTRLRLMVLAATLIAMLCALSAPADPPPAPQPPHLNLQYRSLDGSICDPPMRIEIQYPRPDRGIIVMPVAPDGAILRMQIDPKTLEKTTNGTIKVPVTWPPASPQDTRLSTRWLYPGRTSPPPQLVTPQLDLRGLRQPRTRSPFDLDIGKPPGER